MDFQEEQANEIAALESIYGTDFTVLSQKPPSFKLVIAPTSEADANFVDVTVQAKYPPKYPEQAPELSILASRGLSDTQTEDILELAERTASENLGNVSIFMVAEAVKEWLIAHNVPERNLHEEAMSRSRKIDEDSTVDDSSSAMNSKTASEPTKPARIPLVKPGILVTRESFAMWQKLFQEEQARARQEQAPVEENKELRLTGRQLFERNAQLGLEDPPEEEAGKDEVFWFNESAYDDDDPALNEPDSEPVETSSS